MGNWTASGKRANPFYLLDYLKSFRLAFNIDQDYEDEDEDQYDDDDDDDQFMNDDDDDDLIQVYNLYSIDKGFSISINVFLEIY